MAGSGDTRVVTDEGEGEVAAVAMVSDGTRISPWPPLEPSFHARARTFLASRAGISFQTDVAQSLLRIRGELYAHGVGAPLLVRRAPAQGLKTFASSYHRCVEVVVRAWGEVEEVRRVVRVPDPLDTMLACCSGDGERVHLCRLDFLPEPNGDFKVAETNANCPGGLMTAGQAAAMWRSALSDRGVAVPAPLPHERQGWMAAWFAAAAEEGTGRPPDFVVLLRWQGETGRSVPGLAAELRAVGIEVEVADPRELESAAGGRVHLRGREVRYAYWQSSMRGLRSSFAEIRPLVAALKQRTLFVQNGIAGRLVGDNKLLLAVLSDPSFESLFDPEDLEQVRGHIPWSRNIARSRPDELRDIRFNRHEYVLKHPLDTRGQGVVIGRDEAVEDRWDSAVDTAVRESWLVQRYHQAASLEDGALAPLTQRYHDICLGLVDGRIVGAMSRSSRETRTNVALEGCLHPVFVEGAR